MNLPVSHPRIPTATYRLQFNRSFTFVDAMKVVPLCDHCGNFRLEPVVLHTVDELISSGWIKKKD